MSTSTGRRLALLLLPMALLAAAASAGAQNDDEEPVVTAAVQVTQNPDPVRAHSSPQIARNPENGELVIAETDVFGNPDFGVKIHISADEGRTWAPGGDPMMKPFTWNSDLAINGPYFTMVFDGDAVLYAALSATDPRYGNLSRNDRPRPIVLARSTDGGRSFTHSFVYQPTEGNARTVNNRRPMVAVDPEDSSNVYVGWLQTSSGEKSRSMLAASTDGGRTFGAPVDLAEPVAQGGYQPRPAVGRDGALHAIFPGAGFSPPVASGQPTPAPLVRPVFHRRSADNGRTWSDPVEIDPGSAGFSHNRKHLLAADPRSGTLYAVWYGIQNTRPALGEDTDIMMRVSRDDGATWSDVVVINDDASRPNVRHYDPGISIAPNGRVDVAWYDFRDSPTPEADHEAAPFNQGGYQHVYYSSSTDQGRSWSPNVRVSDRLIDRNIGVWSNNVHSHYNVGVASDDEAVYFAWQDSRHGDAMTNAEDVYFSALYLDGAEVATADEGSSVPGWILLAAGIAVGMGVAMLLVSLLARRPERTPARVSS
jgi:hypothetical protein